MTDLAILVYLLLQFKVMITLYGLNVKKDCDLGNELETRFRDAVEKGCDETDVYSDLLELGIDVETVRRYMGDECADHMKSYCENHGLI